MFKNRLRWLNERTVFYTVLLFNIVLVCSIKFYPSGDGPVHLYNANIICHLLKGDSPLLNNFFMINKFPVPNWIEFFILSLFHFILPGWLAEKLFLLIYLSAICFSFRLLIKQLNNEHAYLSFLIFPFAFSFFFHMVFYYF